MVSFEIQILFLVKRKQKVAQSCCVYHFLSIHFCSQMVFNTIGITIKMVENSPNKSLVKIP